jgi:DNA-binding transcriptional ArsR family regulator
MTYDTVLDALADRTRRRVFESLRSRAMTVRELAELQPVSRPAVSQHLRVLETAGLVNVEAQGNRRLYSIRREGLEELRTYVESFWSDVLGAFAAEIELRKTKN